MILSSIVSLFQS